MIDTFTDEQLDRARARTHERVDELTVTPRPRSRRKLPALALAATAAAAAAVAFAPGSAPTRVAVATAATVLRDFEPQPLPTLASGEYYAVRVVQRDARDHEDALDLRYWADANGKVHDRSFLDGKERRADATPPPPVNARKLPELRDFPTEPQALAAKMRELATATHPPGERREPTTRDYIPRPRRWSRTSAAHRPRCCARCSGSSPGCPG